jgi:hypothetical protein
MPQEIKGTLVAMWLSETEGANYKTIVCEDSSQSSTTASVTTTKTKCGTFAAPETAEKAFSGSGVAGGNLAANQVSFKQLQAWCDAGTLLYFVRRNEANVASGITAGEIVYLDGQGYVTEATETSAEGDVVKFNWAFTATGTVDNTADS